MKKLFFVLALATLSLAVNAQDEPTKKYSVATNSFWSNWFVEAGANWNAWYSSQEHGSNNNISPIKKFRSNVGASVAIGKWFTPGIGLRTKVQGIWGKAPLQGGEYDTYKFWNVQEQVLFNVSNMICGYNEKRVWNLIPFLGAGIHRNMTTNCYSEVYSAGIKNTFRLCDLLALNLEVGYNWGISELDGYKEVSVSKRPWEDHDNKFYAEVGFTVNLGKSTWAKTPDVDAIKALYQSQIDALNGQLNDANAEIARLKNLLANQKPVEPKTVKEVVSFPVTVFYNIGKTAINSDKDLVNVKNFAKVAADNNAKVVVTGFADSSTGSDAINSSLAETRANVLADKLVEYGVSRDNITVESKGGVAELSPVALDRRATAEMK